MIINFSHYVDLILNDLVVLIDNIGYLGIFIGMFLESTCLPVPSEVIMIPVGISVSYGHFNPYLAIAAGVAGNVSGAIFSYYLAAHFGRPILFRIGKYIFVKEKTIINIETYFKEHGEISTFIGRIIPGVRHYISLIAGVARMNFLHFCFFTSAGSLVWISTLTYLGYLIGENKDLIKQYVHMAIIICLVASAVLALVYSFIYKRRKRLKSMSQH